MQARFNQRLLLLYEIFALKFFTFLYTLKPSKYFPYYEANIYEAWHIVEISYLKWIWNDIFDHRKSIPVTSSIMFGLGWMRRNLQICFSVYIFCFLFYCFFHYIPRTISEERPLEIATWSNLTVPSNHELLRNNV